MNNIVDYIYSCLKLKNLSWRKLAALTEQSQSNLANKVNRGNFSTAELEKFAAALDADLDIRFIDRVTGQPITQAVASQYPTLMETQSPKNLKISVKGDVKSVHELFNRLSQNITFPNNDYNASTETQIPSDVKLEVFEVAESKQELF